MDKLPNIGKNAPTSQTRGSGRLGRIARAAGAAAKVVSEQGHSQDRGDRSEISSEAREPRILSESVGNVLAGLFK